jgi:hypothetical protein
MRRLLQVSARAPREHQASASKEKTSSLSKDNRAGYCHRNLMLMSSCQRKCSGFVSVVRIVKLTSFVLNRSDFFTTGSTHLEPLIKVLCKAMENSSRCILHRACV